MATGEVLVIVQVQQIFDEPAFEAHLVQARGRLLARGPALLGAGARYSKVNPAQRRLR